MMFLGKILMIAFVAALIVNEIQYVWAQISSPMAAISRTLEGK